MKSNIFLNNLKFVIDTNVLVSAVIFAKSKPRQTLDKIQERGILLMSESVFEEVEEVLMRPKFDKYIPVFKRKIFIEKLRKVVKFIDINERIAECRDQDDNKYLELAVNGGGNYIITGDQDLLVLNPFREIKIITVTEFLSYDFLE
jgi:putative PIN family toxin of toxin-antitoxin system